MKRPVRWAIGGVAVGALLVCYAFELVLRGAFVVPVRYGWNVPVPNGGTIVVRGVGDVGFAAGDARFDATYRPASSASTSTAPEEPIATWHSEMWNPVAYNVGAAIVFLPDAYHPFVRTARGRWKPLTIDAAPTASVATSYVVRHVSPETRSLIVDRQSYDGTLARFFLQLSVDGERLTITRVREASP